MRGKIIYILTVMGAFFIGVVGTYLVIYNNPIKSEIADEVEKTVVDVQIEEKDTIQPAVEKVYDAVVLVESYKDNKLIGTGTGFVYKKDNKNGYIITNHHVIEKSNSVRVLSINGEESDATLLGSDVYADIAVLSIGEKSVLKVAKLGDSTKLELGDTLFTVGSPLGAEYIGTVTKGILSGKDRTVSVTMPHGNFMMDVIQTDAAINPGNSGGPLVNINGEVIGVNSLKLVEDEIEGMGFAIPIELVMTAVNRLEKGEEIKRPLLGVEMIDVTETYSLYRSGIQYDEKFEAGVAVVSIQQNTPAADAGLKKGDVILEMDNVKITGIGHFRFLLYKYDIGSNVKFKYYRDGKISDINIVLNKSVEDN
ncbi:MAG: trypsin-like peptidase domain-containing protein [Bacilli bacterium]|nr:trypsin-like peptidase domain-containing protein [Bacilli bacterium]MDD4282788.1 trypsin-like peptidase domain-containing protein [Bacilli bacterium]MDD4718352.1 trypsin-like peptidase domain-containing protein [Bacilli bacterium]